MEKQKSIKDYFNEELTPKQAFAMINFLKNKYPNFYEVLLSEYEK